ncbi:MAG TPA: serine/threonine-protein kinase, partial [Gemmatimonadaceae bacterium]|nr:serine/threonine-protein kinase [Gemmatimonadaceae bacterium]
RASLCAGMACRRAQELMFDRALWQRARPLFDELVDLDDNSRRLRLLEVGTDDPSLRNAVEQLLRSDPGSEDALRDYMFGSPGASEAAPVSRDPLGIVGKTVSHFRVTDYLASGGMGVVYTAEDLQLGRTVALKFPLPDQHLDRVVKERFINEARSAGSLDHPNLCTVHEIGESEHGVFLAMPLYPGETLKNYIARSGGLAPAEALDIVTQMATGLMSAHAAGIVHRDLKPGNVMLLPGGAVKILDFGLAKIRDISLTRSQMTLGTLGYVAPEQIRNANVDERTDLWAIGVMLHEMLTGNRPFHGEHEMSILHGILHDEPPRPSALNGTLSSQYDDLIATLLQKDPGDRYPSAQALLTDVRALQKGMPMTHRGPFWSRTAGRRRMRRAAVPVTAIVAVVALIGTVTWNRDRVDANAKSPALKFANNTAVISTSSDLRAALVPANKGRRIRLRAGTYDVSEPLTVPDSMTLEGEGVMQLTSNGLPSGFGDGRRTTLKMTANVGGDILTLGDGVIVRNIEIEDLEGRSGNVVAVMSRRPGDRISATMENLVILNPNPFALAAGGTTGRGILIITRNPNLGSQPAADTGSVISVQVRRSLVRSPSGGGGFFAFNFAADSRISLDISRSVIGGSNELNGGVSRPDAVHDSQVSFKSEGNIYRNEWADPCASPMLGWNLTGGSAVPLPIAVPATVKNRLSVRSVNDRIEGFTTGVLATGSRRFFDAPLNAAPRDNHIDLRLIGTRITTPSCAPAGTTANTSGIPAHRGGVITDLRLIGAWVENDALSAGDNNSVRVELRGVTGSNASSRFASTAGGSRPLAPRLRGTGNKLEIIGDAQTFAQTNRGIAPLPAAEFFSNR